jgi:hypothetical protein
MQNLQVFYSKKTAGTTEDLSNKGDTGCLDVRSDDGLAHQPYAKAIGRRQRRLVVASTLVLADESPFFADTYTACKTAGFSPTPAADIAQADKTSSQEIHDSGGNGRNHIVYRTVQL